MARDIVGAEDFIAVQMPLFKKNQPKGKTLPVMMEDLAVVSAAYRAMLEKFGATVPNIDWERSVIGGHSNGAHGSSPEANRWRTSRRARRSQWRN